MHGLTTRRPEKKSQPGVKKQNPSLNRTSDDKEVMLFVQKKKVLQRYYWETFAEDLINNNFGSTTFSLDLADNFFFVIYIYGVKFSLINGHQAVGKIEISSYMFTNR